MARFKYKDPVTGAFVPVAKKEEVDNVASDLAALDSRVDLILTTPVEGVSAQEIIDARQGEASLGAKFTKVGQQINDLDAQKADKTELNTTNIELATKASLTYVNGLIGDIGATATFKGSDTNANILAKVDMSTGDEWYDTTNLTYLRYNGTSWIDVGTDTKYGDNSVSETTVQDDAIALRKSRSPHVIRLDNIVRDDIKTALTGATYTVPTTNASPSIGFLANPLDMSLTVGKYLLILKANISIVGGVPTVPLMSPQLYKSSTQRYYSADSTSDYPAVISASGANLDNNVTMYAIIDVLIEDVYQIYMKFSGLGSVEKTITTRFLNALLIPISDISNNYKLSIIDLVNSYGYIDSYPILNLTQTQINNIVNSSALKSTVDTFNAATLDYSMYKLAYIKDQRLCCNDSTPTKTAKYTGIDLGSGITPAGITCKAIWEAGTSGGSVAIISNPNGLKSVDGITAKSLHVTFTPLKVDVGFFDNEVLVVGFTYTYSTPVACDGVTEYEFGFNLSPDFTKIYVICPDGTSQTYTATGYNVASYIGRYITWEHYYNTAGIAKPMFTLMQVQDSTSFIFKDDFNRENGAIGNNQYGYQYIQLTNAVTL